MVQGNPKKVISDGQRIIVFSLFFLVIVAIIYFLKYVISGIYLYNVIILALLLSDILLSLVVFVHESYINRLLLSLGNTDCAENKYNDYDSKKDNI